MINIIISASQTDSTQNKQVTNIGQTDSVDIAVTTYTKNYHCIIHVNIVHHVILMIIY